MLGVAAFQKSQLQLTGGSGTDILCCDIPKSLMVLRGQDPYSAAIWESPYPPFFLLVYAGIIRLTTPSLAISQKDVALMAMNIRVAGMVADLAIAVLVFLVLRALRASRLNLILPVGVSLFLPSTSSSNYYFFLGDVFWPVDTCRVLARVCQGAMVYGEHLAGAVSRLQGPSDAGGSIDHGLGGQEERTCEGAV